MSANFPQGLREFLTVVESQSFSKAAEQLNISRARVSQIISRLEKDMGVQLLYRSTRSLSLSPAGETFYQLSRQGVDQLEHAVLSAQNAHASIGGQIRINAVGGLFGEEILAPLLLRFMRDNPKIEIELSFSSTREDLIESQYDLVVRMGSLTNSNLIGRRLTRYANYLVASPAYVETMPKLNSPKDLLDHTLINGSVKRWSFTHLNSKEKYELPVQGKLKCSNGHVVKQATLEGLGISRQPAYYVEQDIQSGRLIQPLPDWQLPHSDVSLLYPKSRNISLRVKALVHYLVEAFSIDANKNA
ncbi:LysR family transcriptional regulator [Marinomonas sp. M1K-6]|uniref:LysR family transcriptional regulator n=1 Tax=Marinomonas profundi TaxID=2726122 RepID=A0A847R2Z9_9GAMM|nr:LysR family transcriptional regulator [Marinomonas profundi]NLQ16286.1 LysR family transcriptional regulator [Marinomonas profundi]UDV03138.1 LysR family transcriptional regulator [Marinomonas profundi]